MNKYEGATICRNGHVISINQANCQEYCEICGKETYSNCKSCGAPIHGIINSKWVVDLTGYYEKPYYCYNCGQPYPWTQEILDNATEILSLEEDIPEETKKLIKDAIPNLLTETPKTPLAIAQYKKGMSKASEMILNSIKQLLIDVVCEMAKKSIFQ